MRIAQFPNLATQASFQAWQLGTILNQIGPLSNSALLSTQFSEQFLLSFLKLL